VKRRGLGHSRDWGNTLWKAAGRGFRVPPNDIHTHPSGCGVNLLVMRGTTTYSYASMGSLGRQSRDAFLEEGVSFPFLTRAHV